FCCQHGVFPRSGRWIFEFICVERERAAVRCWRAGRWRAGTINLGADVARRRRLGICVRSQAEDSRAGNRHHGHRPARKSNNLHYRLPQLSGFIETDGTLGFLQASNISNFSVSWNGGGWGLGYWSHLVTFQAGNTSGVSIVGDTLFATSDQLLVTFDPNG